LGANRGRNKKSFDSAQHESVTDFTPSGVEE